MIRNFEEYTDDLGKDEITYIMPRLIQILILAIGKDKAITNSWIIKEFHFRNPIWKPVENDPGLSFKIKTSGPRLRHMIHIIRVSGTIPCLIATGKGYYIGTTKEEIETYLGSLDDRLRAISKLRHAIKEQLDSDWGKKVDAIQRQFSVSGGELTFL